jgi:hypothetical protein
MRGAVYGVAETGLKHVIPRKPLNLRKGKPSKMINAHANNAPRPSPFCEMAPLGGCVLHVLFASELRLLA